MLHADSIKSLERMSQDFFVTADALVLGYHGFPNETKRWIDSAFKGSIPRHLPYELVNVSRSINGIKSEALSNSVLTQLIRSDANTWKETPHVDKVTFDAGMPPLSLWLLISGAVKMHFHKMPFYESPDFDTEIDRLLDNASGTDRIRSDAESEFASIELVEPTLVVFPTGQDKSLGIHPSLHLIQTVGTGTRMSTNVTYCDFYANSHASAV